MQIETDLQVGLAALLISGPSLKQSFQKIPQTKRETIIQACIEEFATHGYEQGSTDRIIKRAGISKGGLYEYISSKRDLYLFIVDHVYSALYRFIELRLAEKSLQLSQDILCRFRMIASIAIDFYIEHPSSILFIVKSGTVTDTELQSDIRRIFFSRFNEVFGDVSERGLAFPKEQVMDLLVWLLVKTRNDFVLRISSGKEMQAVREEYLSEWDLYLKILENGIYSQNHKEKCDGSWS